MGHKMKTHKASAKRIKITGAGKMLKRVASQGHFNARERGLTTMNKRRDLSVSPEMTKVVKRLLPYA
jgi:large subunit ribosomal protein L35